VYAYNQGTPVALAVARYEATGERSHLDGARATARASLAHFDDADGDRRWHHEPCFNAIWLRNLRALAPHAPADDIARIEATIRLYADRLWRDGRNPRTGWFTEGGIGRYDKGGVLDQAGVVQVLVLAARP